MIGLDTNVLVRYLTHDDPGQARRVRAFVFDALERNEGLFIDDIVLCEAVWVLRASFHYEKSEIVEIVDQMLDAALFVFEDRNLLREALHAYRIGSGDFADHLIGLRNARVGCDHTVTFDRALKNHAGFVLL